MRLVPRPGGGLLFAATAAITTLVVVACAKGTDNVATDTDEGGIVEDAAGRDVNVIPTPKDAAAGDTGTTPEKDSGGSCTGKVVINEVKTEGTGGANDEMIELYNSSSCAVDLGNWTIKYQSGGGSSPTVRATFPNGASIGANAYLVLTPGGSTALTPGMSASDGQVGLLDDTSKIVDAVAWGTVTSGSYREGQSASAAPSNGSIGRSPNGGDTNNNKTDFKGYGTASPGIANP